MDIVALLHIAEQFRRAIKQVPASARPVTMEAFPLGCCGDATLLLGAHLVDLGIKNFKYICGERGRHSDSTWTSHAWLQAGDCVIDITADQFTDAPSSVIVAEPSPWHARFEYEAPMPSDFRLWSGYGAEVLHPMYALVKQALSRAHNFD